MQRGLGACLLFAFAAIPMQSAGAGSLPDIKISAANKVPACATPGRMMDYLKSRNSEVDPRYEGVATEYMRFGEMLDVRWDYAFYQMIVETGALSYRRGNRSGDVKPAQNNFAGLGATGGGEHGDSFKDIASGVRGHLEHLLMYSGQKVDNPVAERTRKVQEWGVLTSWQQKFTRPINFSDLAAKWAPGSGAYGKMLEAVAEKFDEDFCSKPDPRPELVAEARGQQPRPIAALDAKQPADAKPIERPSGADLARRAIDDSKKEQDQTRSALGVQGAAKPAVPFKVLNAPAIPEPDKQLTETPAIETPTKPKEIEAKAKGPATTTGAIAAKPSAPADKAPMRVASAAGAAKQMVEPPAAGQKCRVWTASYGGQKAMIIRSLVDKVVNYTVLDVNEGAETREAEAFIAAYAKDGKITGEFTSQSQALDKAFELCPEG
jgi:Mannosyl-glycoprotein endo-beta-N-acetylglucosaminidase